MKHFVKLFLSGMVVLLLVTNLSAQGPDTLWTKTYGGIENDEGWSVEQTTDGGYIIFGWTISFGAGNEDFYLIKTDWQGDTLWTKTFGGADRDWGLSVHQTSDGGYIMTGEAKSFGAGNGDVYLIKTDTNGDTLWTRTFGGTNSDAGHSVQQTSDGGYIIAGHTWSYGAGSCDIYLIKTDSSGDTLWIKTYGGTGKEYSQSVQQTLDGGYIIAGETWSYGAGGIDVWLLRTDAQGDTLWTKIFGGSEYDAAYSVKQTTDGGFIVVGYTQSFGTVVGVRDVWLIRIDSFGDTLWTKTYGGTTRDFGESVQQTFEGGYIITAWTSSFGAGSYDVWLLKTDANGDTLWTKTYGGTSKDYGTSAQQTTDGGYIIAGRTESYGAGGEDVYLIKTNPLLPFNLISPSDSSIITTTRPTFIWESSYGHGVIWRDYEVFIDDTPRVSTPDTIWTADYDLSEGFHTWYVVVYDSFGNSKQSNQIWNVGIDTSPPFIESTTVWTDTSYAGPFPVYSKVTDFSRVDTVLLVFKRTEDPSWFFAEMIEGMYDWYYGEIPYVFLQNDTVKYFIFAKDIFQNESTDPPGAPGNYYSFIANMVGIDEALLKPVTFSFGVNSPVKEKAIFRFSIPERSKVSLKIYDITGRLIFSPVSGEYLSGYYQIPFKPESKGIYFYKLKSPYRNTSGKLLIF